METSETRSPPSGPEPPLPKDAVESDAFQKLKRGHMNIAEKDLTWALQLARESGVTLPVTGQVAQSMARLYGIIDEGRR